MIDDKIVKITEITVPIFLMVFLGYYLNRTAILNDIAKKSLSWIAYYCALPALVLGGFLQQNVSELFSKELVIFALVPVVVSILVLGPILFVMKTSFEKKNAALYCSYWGNNGYMGIPLLVSSIGLASGSTLAALFIGITTPIYIGFSIFLMVRLSDRSEKKHSVSAELLKIFINPLIIVLGIGLFFFVFRIPETIEKSGIIILQMPYHIVKVLVTQLGNMGLPLVLILLGSSLRFKGILENNALVIITVIIKLIIAPLSVYLPIRIFFPELNNDIVIALVLLNAVPVAVASYIISSKYNVATEFVSSVVVVSTALSILTLPIWLYIIL